MIGIPPMKSLNGNTTLQRYMPMWKFESMLKSQALWVPNISEGFDDKLEGGLTLDDYLALTNEASLLDAAINCSWPGAEESREERRIRLKEGNRMAAELSVRTFLTPFGEYLCDSGMSIFPKCKENLYVSCWYQSEYECQAMWQLYGKNNKESNAKNHSEAVLVFTDLDRLKSHVGLDNDLNSRAIFPVEYIDHHQNEFSDKCFGPFISKLKPYAFEKEVRLVSWNSDLDLNVAPKTANDYELPIKDLSLFITKIIISPIAPKSFIERVESLCKQYSLSDKLCESDLRRQPIEELGQALDLVNSKR